MLLDNLVVYMKLVGVGLLLVLTLFCVLAAIVVLRQFCWSTSFPSLQHSCLYYGRVQHTRLKGGAIHHIDYPIFFCYLDLFEAECMKWSFWPIFKVNSPSYSFCSFDYHQHLKDFRGKNSTKTLHEDMVEFCKQKSTKPDEVKRLEARVLTHLTYFGYCFNPISIYYLFDTVKHTFEAVIAEVSNTPWIEMYSYFLHESVPTVEIRRTQASQNVDEKSSNIEKQTKTCCIQAKWKKEFHVSPFMEMDYHYVFEFFEPKERVVVRSKMLKDSTNEVWFTANFDLTRLPFTPINLLYVLIFYPLQTRLIQVYIHYEAFWLLWKGVPFFNHPQGTDVDFGWGITGERLAQVLWIFYYPIYKLYQLFTVQKSSFTIGDDKKD